MIDHLDSMGPPVARVVARHGSLPSRRGPACALALALALAPAISAAGAPKDPLNVPSKSVLVTTTINAGPDLSASLTEFFTGEKTEKDAINVLLGIHRIDGEKHRLLASRDYNADAGGFVSRASLQVIDLDRDGTNEILVEYHHKEPPGATRVALDVFRIGTGKLVPVWTGLVRVDTTSPALGLPPSERDKFVREVDYAATAERRGAKLCVRRTALVAAGAVLDPPRVADEEFDFPKAPAPSRPGAK